MRVCKEVCLLFGCVFGTLSQVQAFLTPAANAVEIDISPVPEVVCVGSVLTLNASIDNVEGPAVVRISSGSASALGRGLGAAQATLLVDACAPGLLTVFYHFGEHGTYSSNVVVVGVATVEAVPAGPVCAPTQDPIRYRAYPTDAAGYDICPPSWSGPNVMADPQDPWRASARCDRGGYYHATASLGVDPPCRQSESSVWIMACEVRLREAFDLKAPRPSIFPNVCINAQPEYLRAHYQVEVMPKGTRAELSVAEDSVNGITLSQNSVEDGGTFFVRAGQTPGRYRIRAHHADLSSCQDEAEGTVFRFQLAGSPTGLSAPSVRRGVGMYNAGKGEVAAATPDASAAGHGALLTREYAVRVETVPSDAFAGRVRTEMEVVHSMVPSARIFKNSRADRGTVGVSGRLGFVQVSVSWNGPHSVATATFNAQVQVENGPVLDAGSFTYSSDDFGVPLLWVRKSFGGKPIIQTLLEVPRVFRVGPAPGGLRAYARIGVLCLRKEARGRATVEEARAVSQLEFKSAQEAYEILP